MSTKQSFVLTTIMVAQRNIFNIKSNLALNKANHSRCYTSNSLLKLGLKYLVVFLHIAELLWEQGMLVN